MLGHHVATPRGLCYSYVRMSSASQVEGDSERRQIEAAERYAEAHGLRLAPPMKDLGVSAFKGRHRKDGALGLFLKGIQDGEIAPGTLIIEAIDRLSREPPTRSIGMLTAILDAGFVIHILSNGWTIDIKTVNEVPFLLQGVVSLAQLAHTESVQKSDRISKAYEQRRAQARAGKLLKGNYHPAWLERSYEGGRVTHTVIEPVADAIRMIFELATTGMGAHMIAKTLNERNVPVVPACIAKGATGAERQANRRWFQSYVGRLMLDRRVLGEYQPKRIVEGKAVPEGDPIPGHYPAIISPELFMAVRASRNPKLGRKTGARNNEFSNLFTDGLAVCGHCGSRMLIQGAYQKGQKPSRLYLRCSRQMTGSECVNRRMPRYEYFEAKVLDALPAIPWSDLLSESRTTNAIKPLEGAIAEIDLEVERLNKASARLLRMMEEEDEPDPEAKVRRREIREELKALAVKRVDLVAELDAAQVASKTDHSLIANLSAMREKMNHPDQTERCVVRQKMHMILRRVIKEGVFFKDDCAYVHIRGGMCLRVPYDATTPAEAGFAQRDIEGAIAEFFAQEWKDGIPPMMIGPDGKTIVSSTRGYPDEER